MDWTQAQDNWPALIGPAKDRWPEVPEAELTALTPTKDELTDLVARHGGTDRPEAARQIAEWLNGPMPADAYADPTHDMTAAGDAGKSIPDGEDVYTDDRRFGDDHTPDPPMGRT